MNSDVGWVIGIGQNGTDQGKFGVLHTVNGGQSWMWSSLGKFEYAYVQDFDWVDEANGWLILSLGGDEGSRLLESHDGGSRWVQQSGDSFQGSGKQLTAVKFISGDVGYLFYDDTRKNVSYLLDTDDGGKTWGQTRLSKSVSHCEQVGAEVWCGAGMDLLKLRRTDTAKPMMGP